MENQRWENHGNLVVYQAWTSDFLRNNNKYHKHVRLWDETWQFRHYCSPQETKTVGAAQLSAFWTSPVSVCNMTALLKATNEKPFALTMHFRRPVPTKGYLERRTASLPPASSSPTFVYLFVSPGRQKPGLSTMIVPTKADSNDIARRLCCKTPSGRDPSQPALVLDPVPKRRSPFRRVRRPRACPLNQRRRSARPEPEDATKQRRRGVESPQNGSLSTNDSCFPLQSSVWAYRAPWASDRILQEPRGERSA